MSEKRRTNIITTLGPASYESSTLRALLNAGTDIFGLNMAHTSHDDYRELVGKIRSLERELQHPVGVMMDLMGPALRIGEIHDEAISTLQRGDSVRLGLDDHGIGSKYICLPHPEIFECIETGAGILIGYEGVRLRIDQCGVDFAETTVIVEGRLRSRLQVKLPGIVIPVPSYTAKDLHDLLFGLEIGVDWIATPFAQTRDEFLETKRRISGRAAIIGKIDNLVGVKMLKEQVWAFDAITVHRSDLADEIPVSELPAINKGIIRTCHMAGKPVVIASDIMESMIDRTVPTRAEASDLATAVYDGADAIKLSAETAAGNHPVEAVETMSEIIERTEQDSFYQSGRWAVKMDLKPAIENRDTSISDEWAEEDKATIPKSLLELDKEKQGLIRELILLAGKFEDALQSQERGGLGHNRAVTPVAIDNAKSVGAMLRRTAAYLEENEIEHIGANFVEESARWLKAGAQFLTPFGQSVENYTKDVAEAAKGPMGRVIGAGIGLITVATIAELIGIADRLLRFAELIKAFL